MNDIKWIRLSTDIWDDEKIKLIEALPDKDTILVIWLKLLTTAGRCNNDGYLSLNENIPYTDEMLSTIFNRPLNTIRFALQIFRKFGMIEMDDVTLHVTNWEKNQNIEGMEKIRQQTRIRVQKHRENKAIQTQSSDVTLQVTLRNATDKNRIDKNRIEEYKEINKEKPFELSSESTITSKENFKKWTRKEFGNEVIAHKEYKKYFKVFLRYWLKKNNKGKYRFQLEDNWDTKKRLLKFKQNDYTKPKFIAPEVVEVIDYALNVCKATEVQARLFFLSQAKNDWKYVTNWEMGFQEFLLKEEISNSKR